MNMGRRIAARLAELGWKQKDLVDRVPDLTPQTLSNLVKRDSHRSDWERAIADALGVSVSWLVYGQEDVPSATKATPPADSAEVSKVSALMRRMTPTGKAMVLDYAAWVAARHSEVVKANAA